VMRTMRTAVHHIQATSRCVRQYTVYKLYHGKHEGWPGPYMCTVNDRMYGEFFARNTVCTPYIV